MKENRETFLKRFPGLSSKEQFMLEFAYDIAKEGHGYLRQTRDGGERYFEHVRQVALILHDIFGINDVNLIIVALLHDLPEDVHIWKVPGRITLVFGREIGGKIHTLTKPNKDTFESKDAHLTFYFQQIQKSGWDVCLVKIADRIHNLGSMESGSWTSERKSKYVKETETYFPNLISLIKFCNPSLGILVEEKLEEALNKIRSTVV